MIQEAASDFRAILANPNADPAQGLTARECLIRKMLACELHAACDAIALLETIVQHFGLDDSEETQDALIHDSMRAVIAFLKRTESARSEKPSENSAHAA